jgi:H+-transporting ATPase
VLMPPLGWKWAGIVWGYALSWLFLEDFTKLAAYRILGMEHSGYLRRGWRKTA